MIPESQTLLDFTKEHVVAELAKFAPDEDLYPIASFIHKGGIDVALIDHRYMESAETKDNLAVVIASWCRKRDAHLVALAAHTWFLMATPEEQKQIDIHGTISDNPKRTEAITIQVIDHEAVTMAWALLTRNEGKPPTLGEWKQTTNPAELRSRFVDPIRRAVTRNN